MGKRDTMMERNRNARKLKQSDSMHRNCIRLHPQNTKEHEMKKVELCWELLQQGKEFITEARFKKGDMRADIYVLDNGDIYEIESSPQNLEERKKHYPEGTEIIKLWEDTDDTGDGALL